MLEVRGRVAGGVARKEVRQALSRRGEIDEGDAQEDDPEHDPGDQEQAAVGAGEDGAECGWVAQGDRPLMRLDSPSTEWIIPDFV